MEGREVERSCGEEERKWRNFEGKRRKRGVERKGEGRNIEGEWKEKIKVSGEKWKNVEQKKWSGKGV